MYNETRILLVGCGKMGTALIAGWKDAGIPQDNILIIEPEEDHARNLQERYGVEVLAGIEYVENNFDADIVVFAIKPQIMDKALPAYADFNKKGRVFLSIAAGKDTTYLESKLGKGAAIVRAMPNLPATIGKGIAVLTANKKVTNSQKAQASAVMEAVGKVLWIDDESKMDMVTAISGSGPAYMFYFMEALIEAGVSAGFTKEFAKKLVIETATGASIMAGLEGHSIEELRKQVTSPGGTTEAALQVLLEGNKFKKLIADAVKAAERRSKELKG